ncbi:hybrid sensor histidine kinase/response regulator [Jannaschia formosa]|uniref:hybrid sensor histidine kinase/response regulator n=1 Tax=Jannaschia formosa TaxID=2259592 RepID=UPI000E1C2EB4|nr:ATP-binding protein [Jannaschia formosa]TFL17771.1 response regulator [Jannaschia formosa]
MARPDAPPDRRDLLAHDIRAAVSDVIGGLRLIDPDDLSEVNREQLGRIHVASELLARLVEEMLLDAPAEQAEVGVLNLRRFLDDELRRWHGAGRPTGTRVMLDRTPEVPEVVRLDGLHLRRVVANLMGNALRHAPGGRVVLGAEVHADGTLSLCVSDDGPGFPDDLLPLLFRPATRGSRSAPGTGMGLHIASAHAEGLGGKLSASNLPSGGARVTMTVPERVWKPQPEEDGAPNLTGWRVLVADDSGTNQALLRAMLARLGAECEVAGDGIEALNWLSRERFDLALVDLEMPRLGGMDVIRSEKLRQARGVAPPMVMIAMTAYVLSDNREAILEAGADGILGKPIPGLEVFGRTLKAWLEDAPDPEAWKPELAPPFSAALLAELMSTAGAKDGAALIARLQADLGGVAHALGQAAGEDDLPAIRAQSHVLMSLAGTIGALPTEEAARRVNRLAHEGDAGAVRIAARTCLGRLEELREMLADLD